MKAILGLFIIIIGIFFGIYVDIFLLITSIFDILKNIDTITIWEFTWDVVKIIFREFIAFIIAGLIIVFGIALIKSN